MSKKRLCAFIIIIILILLLIAYLILKGNTRTTENNTVESIDVENTEQLSYKFFERGFIPYNDMTYFNNIYYQKLNSLEEYSQFKTKATSLPESETNFEENFILVIMTENVSTEYFVPYKIYDENDTLYVGLIKDANTNPDSNAIILEISRDLEENNIEPYKAIDKNIPYANYTPIKELPENYTVEEAQTDNCYVTQDGGVVLNQELAEEFINNYNNSNDAFIRIVQFSNNSENIMDIYYSSTEEKFLVCIDNTRYREKTTYNYYEYSNIDKKTLNVGKDGSTDFYLLTDPYEDDMQIFSI